MSAEHNHDIDDQHQAHRATQQADAPAAMVEGPEEMASLAVAPDAVLADSRLNGRGNAPLRQAAVQQMQQLHGNRYAQRFLQRTAGAAVQREAAPEEKEEEPPPVQTMRAVQRQAAPEEEKEEEPPPPVQTMRAVQRTAAAPAAPVENVGERIQARAGGGSALDAGVQGQLEQGLGADMSGVRVHTDGEADHLARSVDSVAFTTGQDIFFRSGAYNPGTTDGMHLLAHEATHTVQQAQGPVAGTPTAGGVSVSDPSDSFERAAEQSAAQVAAGTTAQRQAAPEEEQEEPAVQTSRDSQATPAVQRQSDFQLREPTLSMPRPRPLSLFPPGEQPQLHLRQDLLQLRGVQTIRPLVAAPPALGGALAGRAGAGPTGTPPAPNPLAGGAAPAGGSAPPQEESEGESIWNLDFELDADEDSPLGRTQAQNERIQQTLDGDEVEGTPLGLRLLNLGVNVLGATPQFRALIDDQRLLNRLRITNINVVFNPVEGNYGAAVTFKF